MRPDLARYTEIWAIDFEFITDNGDLPEVVCMVAIEIRSGRTLRLWREELLALKTPPFHLGDSSLFIAYYASAEFACFLELGWSLPVNVVDLFAEYRNLTNGLIGVSDGNSLLSALRYFGVSAASQYKEGMRELILEGGPWSKQEQEDILNYCEGDVIALIKLLPKFEALLTSHSLIRGNYMKAIAKMETQGVPLDIEIYKLLVENWSMIKDSLVDRLDHNNLYEGTAFKIAKFEHWLASKGYSWSRTPIGRLSLSDDTFKSMSLVHPEVRNIYELRQSLSKLKLQNLQVGKDGRNRALLSPFRSKTGRNQPSTAKFIYGPSSWIRSLIKPERGKAIVYIDWEQQEFGIAAALSEDQNMINAYLSGDPYLEFAKLAKAVPQDATKKSHPVERDLYKQCILATQYGMGAESLSVQIGKTKIEAQELLDKHKQVFSTYWNWIDCAVNFAQINGYIQTVFGWTLHVTSATKIRTIQNFPMQANGAEMLRLACHFAIEEGISVCAPIHDALLIEADIVDLENTIALTQSCMRKASKIVLDGFELRSDTEVVRYPDRYRDKRGTEMWQTVCEILEIAA